MQSTLMTIISKLAKLTINDLFTEIIKFLNLDLSSKYIIMCIIDVNITCILIALFLFLFRGIYYFSLADTSGNNAALISGAPNEDIVQNH